MARYLQASQEIAGKIEAGLLGPGDELPSIRDAAARYNTTGSTIARAYRYLADAGVIEVADRRRSRVAAGGDAAARPIPGSACVPPLPLSTSASYPLPGKTSTSC
jgi:DNA-binding transcriptional regulator YhcF (GntR family)